MCFRNIDMCGDAQYLVKSQLEHSYSNYISGKAGISDYFKNMLVKITGNH